MSDDRIRERAAILELADQLQQSATAWQAPAPRRGYSGHPIGHGPLADHAAEPVEFARLIHHLEKDQMVTGREWHDTIPTGPVPLNEADGRWPACGGACSEHARPCPRPRSCWLTTTDDANDGMGAIHGAVWAIGPVIVIALLALLVAWLP